MLRLAARAGDHLVVFGACVIDHPVPLLLGLVDLVPRRFHGVRRVDVLEDDLLDRDAHLVLLRQLTQALPRRAPR